MPPVCGRGYTRHPLRSITLLLRHLEYLVALARERHFARAAETCSVTQSTLSAGIKQLEDSLNVLLVERSHRFVGLTAEGERVLAWARRVLREHEELQQGLSQDRRGLTGQLRLGMIPVSLPIAALLTGPLLQRHPRLTVTIRSLTSTEIQRGLDEFDLDAGVTYLDNEPLARVRRSLLYDERYFLVTSRESALGDRTTAQWAEAATLPLCLLTPDMQNRRILDMHLREAGATATAAVDTNSLITLWSHLRTGRWSSIASQSVVLLLRDAPDLVAIPLTDPVASHQIGLVTSDREPLAPIARAVLDLVDVQLRQRIAGELNRPPS